MKFGYRGVAGRCRACAAFRILMGLALPWDWASADESPRAPFLESLAVYVGQRVDHNLLDLPRSILGGDIAWEASYFAGIGLSGTFGTFGEDIPSLGDNPLGKIRHGCEVVVAKHHGLQDNLEAGAAYLLRTPDAHLGWLWGQRRSRRRIVVRIRRTHLRGCRHGRSRGVLPPAVAGAVRVRVAGARDREPRFGHPTSPPFGGARRHRPAWRRLEFPGGRVALAVLIRLIPPRRGRNQQSPAPLGG